MDQVSRNFRYSEFGDSLSDSDRIKIRWLVFGVLQRVRDYFGKPVKITSWKRDKDKNAAVGGSSTSQHPNGEAVDFIVEGISARAVYDYIDMVIKWPYGQLFYYPDKGHVHVGLGRFDIAPNRGRM